MIPIKNTILTCIMATLILLDAQFTLVGINIGVEEKNNLLLYFTKWFLIKQILIFKYYITTLPLLLFISKFSHKKIHYIYISIIICCYMLINFYHIYNLFFNLNLF